MRSRGTPIVPRWLHGAAHHSRPLANESHQGGGEEGNAKVNLSASVGYGGGGGVANRSSTLSHANLSHANLSADGAAPHTKGEGRGKAQDHESRLGNMSRGSQPSPFGSHLVAEGRKEASLHHSAHTRDEGRGKAHDYESRLTTMNRGSKPSHFGSHLVSEGQREASLHHSAVTLDAGLRGRSGSDKSDAVYPLHFIRYPAQRWAGPEPLIPES